MVRVARRESITIETAAVNDIHHITEQHDIVAGCNTDALGGNRIPASCRCVADRCAMWRWSTPPHAQDGIDRSHMQRTGYCGIAGRPEVAA